MTEIRGHQMSREDILDGTIETVVRDALVRYNVPLKSAEERRAIMRSMLAGLAPGEDPWVFCYGSLIWNPAFAFTESRCGKVFGYHRRFTFWSKMGRGSADRPGMMLGLARGGSCAGLALRVAHERAEHELQSVFMREMMTTSYHARFVPVHTDRGVVRAITFIANPGHVFYAGRVSLETAARHIAFAEGHLGPCRDYLYNTVLHLDAHGIRDRSMQRLLQLVEVHRASPTETG